MGTSIDSHRVPWNVEDLMLVLPAPSQANSLPMIVMDTPQPLVENLVPIYKISYMACLLLEVGQCLFLRGRDCFY